MFNLFFNLFTSTKEKYSTELAIPHTDGQKYMLIRPDGKVEYPSSYDSEFVQFSDGMHHKVYLAGEYLTTKNKFYRFPSTSGEMNPFASSLESLCHTRFDKRYGSITGSVVIEWVDPPSEADIEELNANYYAWATYMNSQC